MVVVVVVAVLIGVCMERPGSGSGTRCGIGAGGGPRRGRWRGGGALRRFAATAGTGRAVAVIRRFGTRVHIGGCRGLWSWVEFTAPGDRDVGPRAVFAVDRDFSHSVQNFLTGHDVAEYGVFCIEMLARGQGDEESKGTPRISHWQQIHGPMLSNDILAAIAIFASIRHAQQTFPIDLSPPDVLIGKVPAVNACSACAIAGRNISALDHKSIDDPMQRRAFVGQRSLAGRRSERGCT